MSDKVVERINDLWYSKCKIEQLKIPGSFPRIDDPLAWGLAMAEADPSLVSTTMRSAIKNLPNDNQMVYVSRGRVSPKTKSELVHAVAEKSPVQLQINAVNKKIHSYSDVFNVCLFAKTQRTSLFWLQLHGGSLGYGTWPYLQCAL